MTVELSEVSARFIDEQVKSGRFPSAEAAIDAGLSRLQAEAEDEVAELQALVDVGIAEADRGDFVEFTAEDVITERRAALARRKGRA